MKGRTLLDPAAHEGATVHCSFDDGQPLLLERPLGRGAVLVAALPFDLETSDLPLRPAFLSLLDQVASRAQTRGGPRSIAAGQTFSFPAEETLTVEHLALGATAPRALVPVRVAETQRVHAARIGRYKVRVGEVDELRYAHAAEREVDLRPRLLAPRARDSSLGGEARKLDVSPHVALALLGLLLVELGLRVWALLRHGRGESAGEASSG